MTAQLPRADGSEVLNAALAIMVAAYFGYIILTSERFAQDALTLKRYAYAMNAVFICRFSEDAADCSPFGAAAPRLADTAAMDESALIRRRQGQRRSRRSAS
jgi:hypothetical protein